MAYGVDVSEHNRSYPDENADFGIIRLLNEYGREDKRWRDHKDAADRRGIATGSYGIVQPWLIDPVEWANRLADLHERGGFAFVPVVDVELGDPGANGDYCAAVRAALLGRGHGVVMGYYSAGSAYRQRTQHLFERHWLASWGSKFPAGADVHQYQGSPLDLNFAFDLERIRQGAAPPPAPPKPPPERKAATEMLMLKIKGGDQFVAITPGHSRDITREVYFEMAAAGVAHREGADGQGVEPLMAIAIAQAWGVEFD